MSSLCKPAPKTQGSCDRTVPLARTLAVLPQLRERYGITRVGELTYLDRLGIPVMTAIVPNSPDALGVYNGKGLTRDHALVSAVMEAVERQIGARYQPAAQHVPVPTIAAALNIREFGLFEDLHRGTLACVPAFDLLSGARLMVPLSLVRTPWPGRAEFPSSHTNGLASGNTLAEAVYHALFELAERHVWSLTHVKAEVGPRLLFGPNARICIDGIVRELRLPTGDRGIDELRRRIVDAGMELRVRVMRDGGLPITMLATIADEEGEMPMVSVGLGCSWSPVHAATRAITEAAQSRLVDIQGAREDIVRRELLGIPHGKWFFDSPAAQVELEDLPDTSSSDLGEELRRLGEAVRALGCPTIAVVDLSPEGAPFAVARVIVPELETYCVDRRIGRAGRTLFVMPGVISRSATASQPLQGDTR